MLANAILPFESKRVRAMDSDACFRFGLFRFTEVRSSTQALLEASKPGTAEPWEVYLFGFVGWIGLCLICPWDPQHADSVSTHCRMRKHAQTSAGSSDPLPECNQVLQRLYAAVSESELP